jgi:hypothetical protein
MADALNFALERHQDDGPMDVLVLDAANNLKTPNIWSLDREASPAST